MSSPTVSLFNKTDGTFHVKFTDEMALRVSSSRVATSNLWLGVLLTLVVALVLLSTAQQRRGPVFILQCLAFVLAIIYDSLVQVRGFWRHHATFRMPEERYDPGKENRVQTTVLVLEHWIPLIANAAIIFKLMGFYPQRLYSRRHQFIRLTPPILLLIARVVLICYITYIANYIYTEASSLKGQVKQVISMNLFYQFVYVGTTIFVLEAAFCLYVSCVLVYKISDFYRNLQQMDGSAIKRKFRFFLELTFMTFLPPLLLSIVCAIELHRSDDKPSKYREVVSSLANISVVSSLLATSWSTIRSRNVQEETQPGEQTLPLVSQFYLDADQHTCHANHLAHLQGVGIIPTSDTFRAHLSSSKRTCTNEDCESIPMGTMSSSTSPRHPLSSSE